MLSDVPNIFKAYNNLHLIPTFLERRQENTVTVLIKKWIQKAMDLIQEEDKVELEEIMGCYLSPRFIKAREIYLRELGKISSKNFNKHETEIKKMCIENRRVIVSKACFSHIKIILPFECLKKKLRCIGILHYTSVKPIGKPTFSCLKDYEIISWYSITAKKL